MGNPVYLIYEDDYGSIFSPKILTKVCRTKEEADAYVKDLHPWMYYVDTVDESSDYPKFHGGLF